MFAFGPNSSPDFDASSILLALQNGDPLTEKERRALLKQNLSAGTNHDAVRRQLKAFAAALEFFTGPNSDPSKFISDFRQHMKDYRDNYGDIAKEYGAKPFYFALLRCIHTCLHTFWTDCATHHRDDVSNLTLNPTAKFTAIQQGGNPFDMSSKKAKHARQCLAADDSSSSDSDSSIEPPPPKHRRTSKSQQSPSRKPASFKHFIDFEVPKQGFAASGKTPPPPQHTILQSPPASAS